MADALDRIEPNRFLDQSFAILNGVAFLSARDDENKTVPETYNGVDDAPRIGRARASYLRSGCRSSCCTESASMAVAKAR
jgi:hypothetical protein